MFMACPRGMQSVQQTLPASSCSQFKHGRGREGQSPGDDSNAASMGFTPVESCNGWKHLPLRFMFLCVLSLTAQLVPTGKPQPHPIHSQQKHASNLYVWRVYFNYTPPKRGRWTHEWTQQRTSSDEELLVSNEWEGRADSHLAN